MVVAKSSKPLDTKGDWTQEDEGQEPYEETAKRGHLGLEDLPDFVLSGLVGGDVETAGQGDPGHREESAVTEHVPEPGVPEAKLLGQTGGEKFNRQLGIDDIG